MDGDACDPDPTTLPGVNDESSPARLAVRSLDDLVGLVPSLIGFHPEESLVVLIIDAGVIALTARVDLAAVREPAGLVELVSRLFDRFTAAEAWFLAYGRQEDDCWRTLQACSDLAGPDRMGRLVQVGPHEWRADSPSGLSGQIRVGPAAVEATVRGWPVRRSRQELIDAVSGPHGEALLRDLAVQARADAERLAPLSPPARRRRLHRLCERAVEPDGAFDRAACVELAVLAADASLREDVVRRLSSDNAAAAVRLWSTVVQHAIPALQPGPLGLLGLASWLTGDGAVQTVCLERLDRLAPLDPLAALLDWINATVLPPNHWETHREPLVAALAAQARVIDGCAAG